MDEFVRMSDDIVVRRKDILRLYSTSYWDEDKGSCGFYCKMATNNSPSIILHKETISHLAYKNNGLKKEKEKEIFDNFLIKIEKVLNKKDKEFI